MAKSDKTRQLTIKQLNAIDQLIAGMNDAETGEAVGVSRQTVNEWRNHDASFVAELNKRRQELWGVQVERLRILISSAIDVLEDELSGDDPKLRHSAAITVMKSVGLYGVDMYPEGGTEAEQVEQEWDDAAMERTFSSLSLMMRANCESFEDSNLIDG
jgi:hypothetical protein